MIKLYTFLFLLCGLPAFAQTNTETENTTSSDSLQVQLASTTLEQVNVVDSANINESYKKNAVKINLSSLGFNNYSLSYERSITRKISFVVGYRFMPKTTASSIYFVDKAIDKYVEEDDEAIDELNAASIGNNTFTGEVRFYTGRKPGARGFYLSLYGRYMNLTADYPYVYEAEDRDYDVKLDGKLNGFGGGLMIGSQWLIAKRVTLDWYILGAHYGKMKVDLNGRADLSTMSLEDRRQLEEDIESINEDLNGKADVDATVTDRGVNVKGNTPFAGIRGFGINVGYAF